jgi:hypothetical protein
MNAIRKWLYVGKYRDTLDPAYLMVRKIGAVLQLAEPIQYRDIESLYLPVEDGVPLESHYLRQGVDFILGQKGLGRNVLVACGSGMSRSAAFVVAILNENEGLDLLEALRVVKSHHPDTMIHPVLWKSLCNLYREDVPFERVLIT